MNKLLEVREFESICCNEDYKDKYHVLPENVFKDLEEFIYSNNEVLDYLSISYKKNVGKIITVKNYVGLIQMKNGYQIQILPKISFGQEDTNNVKTKRIFLKMLRSMKDFPSKVFNDSTLRVDKMNLYEIFINMYVQEVRTLVKHGLKSGYVEQQENNKFFKGKLLVNEQIKHNLVHKEQFYVQYDEFLQNRPENRLIKSTLLKLQKMTLSSENSKEIKQLLTNFERVEESVNYEKDFSKVVINRSTKEYETIIPWSKVFLFNQSFTTFSGNSNTRALLFPMESVYEAYVAQKMKKIFGNEWDVSTQDKGHYLFDSPKKFRISPDIVLKKDDTTIILDTKWKQLIDNEKLNYGISQQDMYQMYAYSKKYDTPYVYLLYPITDEFREHEPIKYLSEDNTEVNVFFVDIEDIEKRLDILSEIVDKEISE